VSVRERQKIQEMPRRGRGLTPLAALFASGIGACSTDLTDSGCRITLETALPGTPLTLLSDARLDRVGTGFFLLGSDGSVVRWAPVGADGSLGVEQSFSLAAGVSSPLVAVAGVDAPGDTILIGWVASAPNGGSELDVVAVPAATGQATTTASAVMTFSTGPAAGDVVMASSRAGMVAGLALIDRAGNVVKLALIDGTGHLTGDPFAISSTGATSMPFGCLSFAPGKQPLTVTFVAETSESAGTTEAGPPTLNIVDATEAGAIDVNQSGPVAMLGCVRLSPTTSGYAWVWADDQGAFLMTSMGTSYSMPQSFASAGSFGGAALAQPLAAVAPFGADFGVVLEMPHGVELWRLESDGQRRPGSLVFPSISGSVGQVSALPIAGAGSSPNVLAVTYPDYTTAPADGTPAGRRVFLTATCL
jgi:hypothetical protein